MRPKAGVTRASQEIGWGPSLSFCEPPQLLGKVTHLPEHIPIPPFPTSWDFSFTLNIPRESLSFRQTGMVTLPMGLSPPAALVV